MRVLVTVTTEYHFTEEGFADYLETLTQFMSQQEVSAFVRDRTLTRSSTDGEGSTATTIHSYKVEL